MENHHFFMGTSTISMVIFNSKLLVYQRVCSNHLFMGVPVMAGKQVPSPLEQRIWPGHSKLQQSDKGKLESNKTRNCQLFMCAGYNMEKHVLFCFLRFCQQEHMTGRTVRTKLSTIHAKQKKVSSHLAGVFCWYHHKESTNSSSFSGM